MSCVAIASENRRLDNAKQKQFHNYIEYLLVCFEAAVRFVLIFFRDVVVGVCVRLSPIKISEDSTVTG